MRRLLNWIFPILGTLDWLLLRLGLVEHDHSMLAIWALGSLVFWFVEIVLCLREALRSKISWIRFAATLLLLGGLATIVASGLVNWALSIQGYVVLQELETVHLDNPHILRALDRGPLADLHDLRVSLQLEELDLLPTIDGGLYPKSRLRVRGVDGKVEILEIDPWNPGRHENLYYLQGSFGFAPHIVLIRDGETLFDEVITFVTEGRGNEEGVVFDRTIPLEDSDLRIEGRVELGSLDRSMRGHASLTLRVLDGERLLGDGTLLPGHFADIEEGYRVGFTGLEQWSEIDFSRRNYRRYARWGGLASLLGVILLVAARVRSISRSRQEEGSTP